MDNNGISHKGSWQDCFHYSREVSGGSSSVQEEDTSSNQRVHSLKTERKNLPECNIAKQINKQANKKYLEHGI